MSDIKQRELKIQEKRKQTPRRDFLKEVASRYSIVFYKNNGKVSIYPDVQRFGGILSIKEFEEYIDTLTQHGLDYNRDLDFFQNYQRLYHATKLPALRVGTSSENSNYANNVVGGSRNAYLSHNVVSSCENVLYSVVVKEKSVNVFNSVMVIDGSENVYASTGIISGFNIFYAKYINNSSNIRFSTNLTGCQECILCANLDNQSYHIDNVKYEKEAYFAKKKELLQQKGLFLQRYLGLDAQGNNVGSQKAIGNFILHSEDIENGYYVHQIQKGRNIIFAGGNQLSTNNFDCFNVGSPSDNFAGTLSAYGENIYCSQTISGSNVYYSTNCVQCSFCLGCIGLRNKSFCILNKEYSKEERYVLVDKIFAQMEKNGILGNTLPGVLNPFYFNDTAAYLVDDSFTKEEVEKDGYLRRDEAIATDTPAGADILEVKDLSQYEGFNEQGEWKINPEILKKVIRDEKGNCYRIMPMELEFLQKHGLPLPELHWLERIKLGFKFK